jgi:hypothetical protein
MSLRGDPMTKVNVHTPGGSNFVCEVTDLVRVMEILSKCTFVEDPWISKETEEKFPNRPKLFLETGSITFSILPETVSISYQTWSEWKKSQENLHQALEATK